MKYILVTVVLIILIIASGIILEKKEELSLQERCCREHCGSDLAYTYKTPVKYNENLTLNRTYCCCGKGKGYYDEWECQELCS